MRRLLCSTFLVAAMAASGTAFAQGAAPNEPATVDMKAPDGSSRGTVKITPTPNGLLFEANLTGFGEGSGDRVHGFHIHQTGKCEGNFDSAGGHYNPTNKEHGYLSANGPHVGDMPNLVLDGSGSARFAAFNPMVTLSGGDAPLNDTDGSAIMVHDMADDYRTQPTGHAGGRVACGVIFKAP